MKLAEIFSNGMVLQREKELVFWGENDRPRDITVQISGIEITSEQIDPGMFEIHIPPQKTSWGEIIEFVESGSVVARLENVKFGEVWLAGGQSNMELCITYDEEYKRLKKAKLSDRIFFYEAPKRYAPMAPIEGQGHWYPCNQATLDQWAAVPYYFANKLSEEIPDCPIGIVSCNMGGSNLLCWLPKELIQEDDLLRPFFDAYIEHCSKLDMSSYEKQFRETQAKQNSGIMGLFGKLYMKGKFPGWVLEKLWKEKQEPMVSQQTYGPWDNCRPCGLYDTMLRPLFGFAFRGVIWYQGESEAKSDRALLYTHTMQHLVACWRKDFSSEFPFITVVLPKFEKDILDNGVLFPEIRRQQRELPQHIPGVYTVEAYESGVPYNIHSPKKRPIGEALARECVQRIYHL